MSDKQFDEQVNRRKFLKVAAVTAVAATTTGAGAALLNSRQKELRLAPALTASEGVRVRR